MTERTTHNADFSQFAGGFGDPLTRLAVLLVDDEELAHQLVVQAFAVLRRRWSAVESSGAADVHAVDALISQLPRTLPPPLPPPPPEPVDDDLDRRRLQAIMTSWSRLRPRQRASLVFNDASVASPRLAGAPMPASLGSTSKVEALAAQAWQLFAAGVRADVAASGWSIDDDELGGLLADCLRYRASTVQQYLPPIADIARRRRHDLNRALLTAAGVVVVILVVAAAVVHVSTSTPAHPAAAAGPAESAIAPPQFTIVTPPTAVASPPAITSTTTSFAKGVVVAWPTRGSLIGDVSLIQSVRSSFAAAHPGLTGPIQLLLLTDTPTFRVAYVTAQTAEGAIGSWFYGDIGSSKLVEGDADLGFSILGPDTVISAALVHDGSRELVALSSPTATSMILQGGPAPTSFLGQQGLGVLDISRLAENGGLQVDVTEADGTSAVSLPRTVDLDQELPEAAGDTTFGYPTVRGTPDPGLLIEADKVATQWQTGNLNDDAVPEVLWGGSDGKIDQVVVRLRTTGSLDVVVIAWSGEQAGADAELLAPNSVDFPLTWDYPDGAGTRIGVLAPIGVSSVRLFVDGTADTRSVPVDANGYASLALPFDSLALPAGTPGGAAVKVTMANAAGAVVTTISEPPPA